MPKEVIREWEPLKPVKNNKKMLSSEFSYHQESIKTQPAEDCRYSLYLISMYSGYELVGYRSMTDFLYAHHGKNKQAYLNALLAANAEATILGEHLIGTLSIAVALELRKIMDCSTSINRVKKFMAESENDWSLLNVKCAIESTCNIVDLQQKRKRRKAIKKTATEKEVAIKYMNDLGDEERVTFIEDFIEDLALREVVKRVHVLLAAKVRVERIIDIFGTILTENAQYILDPSLCDNAKYYASAELLHYFGDIK